MATIPFCSCRFSSFSVVAPFSEPLWLLYCAFAQSLLFSFIAARGSMASQCKGEASRGVHVIVSPAVLNLVEEVLAWQRRYRVETLPTKYSANPEERKLKQRFDKLLARRKRDVGPAPSRKILSASEIALVNSVPGVLRCGRSSMNSCEENNTSIPSSEHTAKKARLATEAASSGGPSGGLCNMMDKVESFTSTAAQSAAAKTQLISTRDVGCWLVETKKLLDGMLTGEVAAEQKICMLGVVVCKTDQ